MARLSTNPYAGGVGRSEHVSLESDLSETRAPPNLTRSLTSHQLSKGGRGVTISVSILQDDYALVETQRGRSSVHRHTVDLRFVDPKPVGIRKVPWRWLHASIALLALFVASIAACIALPNLAHKIGGAMLPTAVGLLTLSGFILSYYLTTESLLFVSVHGRARVITIAGRLGTMRRAHACAADVVTHINIARKHFRQTRQAFLRDEMREHARLYEQGVFSGAQYDEAKKRILKSHE